MLTHLPATLASFLVLKHTRCSPASGPLHWLQPLPHSEICMAGSPTSFICVKICSEKPPPPHNPLMPLFFSSVCLFPPTLYCFFVLLFKNKFIYFIYFLAVLGLRCCARVSLVAKSGGCSSLQCAGFSLRCLLLLWSMGSRYVGFSSWGTQAQ